MATNSIINKLAKKQLKVDKKRNFFVSSAIILTAFTLTSVLSIGFGLFEAIGGSELNTNSQFADTQFSIILGIIPLIALFMYAGYLMIYNVMYLAVSKDVRYYGLLKSLGATASQIKRLVLKQVVRLAVFAIPVGIGLGILLSIRIAPYFTAQQSTTVATSHMVQDRTLETVIAHASFSPFVYLGTVLLTLTAIFKASHEPAEKVATISPIEATKYIGEVKVKAVGKTKTGGKLHHMAWRNIMLDKKRAKVVALSLFLGMTIFLIGTLLVGSLDVTAHTRSEMAAMGGGDSDFIIDGRGAWMDDSHQGQPYTMMAMLSAVDGVESVDFKIVEWSGAGRIHLTVPEHYWRAVSAELEQIQSEIAGINIMSRLELDESFASATRILTIIGGTISGILGLAGVLNFINSISMSIIVRRQEFAMLESIGMTRRQLRRLLIFEGLAYGIFTLGLVLIFGNILALGFYHLLASSWGNFMVFNYPILQLISLFGLIMGACFLIPKVLLKSFYGQSVIEELRRI